MKTLFMSSTEGWLFPGPGPLNSLSFSHLPTWVGSALEICPVRGEQDNPEEGIYSSGSNLAAAGGVAEGERS